MTTARSCTHCGSQRRRSDRFCTQCGQPYAETGEALDSSSAPDVPFYERVYSLIVEAALSSKEDIKGHWRDFCSTGKPFDAVVEFKAFVEFFYVYVHLLDRIAFSDLGEHRRNVLLDQVEEYGVRPMVKTLFPNATEDRRSTYTAEIMFNLSNAQVEYGPCRRLDTTSIEDMFRDLKREEPEAVSTRFFMNLERALETSLLANPVGLSLVNLTWTQHLILIKQLIKEAAG